MSSSVGGGAGRGELDDTQSSVVRGARDDWWWYQKYTCRLKKGTYRIEVYSHDLAGNQQSRIGRAKLVVK